MKLKLVTLTALALVAGIASAQSAAFGKNSQAFVGASNTEFFPYSIATFAQDGNNTGAAISVSGSQSFSGNNSNGDFDTMDFSGSGFASAQHGILRSSASGEVVNSFYNSSNPWYWNSNTSELDENGTPDVFVSVGQATASDTFTYTNYGPAVTVNFFYQVSGTIAGNDAYHALGITVDEEFDFLLLDQFDGNSFNQTWVTQNYSIGDGTINFRENSLSSFSMETQFWEDGSNVSGSANFSSTSTLIGMQLKDINGNVVDGWSMTSASGTVYPVPEPATMTVLGIAALAALRKRKK